MKTIDVDAELDAWHEMQDVVLFEAHRCPNDQPPCPVCQEEIDDADHREQAA